MGHLLFYKHRRDIELHLQGSFTFSHLGVESVWTQKICWHWWPFGMWAWCHQVNKTQIFSCSLPLLISPPPEGRSCRSFHHPTTRVGTSLLTGSLSCSMRPVWSRGVHCALNLSSDVRACLRSWFYKQKEHQRQLQLTGLYKATNQGVSFPSMDLVK